MFNNFRVQNEENENLSLCEKYFKHLTADHKINVVKSGFIQIDFSHANYYLENEFPSGTGINFAGAIGLFLLSVTIIIYNSSKRNSYLAFKIIFDSGFKILPYIPPKYFS
jgi:hypothetical protein